MSRIAYICADPGIGVFATKGASVHVQEIVRAFRKRGDDVTIYCVRTGDERPADLADVPVVRIPIKADSSEEREQVAARVAAELAERAIADGADLVYERYALFSDALARVTETLGIPGILEVNAPLIEEQKEHRVLHDEALAERTLARQLGAANRITCVSALVADWALARGGSPERVVVAPNGVNVDRLQPSPRGPGHPVVVFVGTLKPWHGTDVLIEAAARANTPWRLRIIGSGPEEQNLRAQAAALGVPVDFVGPVAPEEMPLALAGAAVGVAPYPVLPSGQYFSPLKIYEYSAVGLPVVASAVGQVPEIVVGGQTGLLVPPSDPEALASAIDLLTADADLAARMGAAGRDLVEREHTWDQVLTASLGEVA